MNMASSQQLNYSTYLTVKDVAALLHISPNSVYRMVEKRVVRFYKIRSGIRFRLKDVEEYMDSCLVEAI